MFQVMTTSGESPPGSGHEKKNGNLPVVIISEPGSPDVVGKMDGVYIQEQEGMKPCGVIAISLEFFDFRFFLNIYIGQGM
ncbi:unnamed protein product [Haemonchus placei]|uniref:Dirigent protein n=1 Tax=Haemonchus placei TaxID=6290 RepID=A0A158QRC6_HAEPC|nr:unnamed protein product [Haemonchus placei]